MSPSSFHLGYSSSLFTAGNHLRGLFALTPRPPCPSHSPELVTKSSPEGAVVPESTVEAAGSFSVLKFKTDLTMPLTFQLPFFLEYQHTSLPWPL